MKNKIKIAFIGCGNMARAIIESMTDPAAKSVLAANGDVFEITAADRNESKLMPLKPLCGVTLDNAKAVAAGEYVFLTVQPHCVRDAVAPLELKSKVVISVVAGLSIAELKELTGSSKIVRVMPNVNARVGESYNAFSHVGLSEKEYEAVCEILGSFGVFAETDEAELDKLTGITGCGPAFVFTTLKAFFDEAIALGFDAERAMAMAVQTVVGSALAAEKAAATGTPLDALIESVCTKGGATAEGVKYLDDNGYSEILRGAVRASNAKVKKLTE